MSSSTPQEKFKVAVYAPVQQAEAVRHAAHSAGAGSIGSYHSVSFAIPGTSRFTPGPDAVPAIGKPGMPETVDEVKLEFTVYGRDVARACAQAIRDAHPYEEVVCDVYKLEDL